MVSVPDGPALLVVPVEDELVPHAAASSPAAMMTPIDLRPLTLICLTLRREFRAKRGCRYLMSGRGGGYRRPRGGQQCTFHTAMPSLLMAGPVAGPGRALSTSTGITAASTARAIAPSSGASWGK